MGRTKTEEALADAERRHADDPERADMLGRARRFKASWVDLAEGLALVRQEQYWKRWGFSSFEEYTRKELHLRPETADKLTGSYQFLKHKAPEVLDRDGVEAPIPSFQSVDFLRRAEEQEGAPVEAVSELRRRVIDEGAALPALTRKYREVIFPLDAEARDRKEEQALRAAAKRLAELLQETRAVPRGLASEVGETLGRLLAALEEAAGEAEAA